jgi:glycosyltransferase involved in cell wall biosynthesis
MENKLNSRIGISIVCPCYNEEEVISHFLNEITPILNKINLKYEIIFINDGSSDNTLNVLIESKMKNQSIRIINLSRNFGKEAALTAGIEFSSGAVVIPIDVDLQDPPELIFEFITKYQEGFDVVLAQRSDRTSDSFIKRTTAHLFYKLHNKISHTNIPYNVGDYRLMSRKVVEALKQLPENQRFMKGIFAWVGFKTTIIEYKRLERKAGQTSFNGWKLFNFAIDGIVSFSTFPLRLWLYLGTFISTISIFYGLFIVCKTFLFGVNSPGYASLITAILFLGGVQLIGIGVLGEYIGRNYMESKRRPIYIIEGEY